ncbi:thiamine diphosphokinase [Romboutsia sp. 1001713B170207_170306_H8]|uniref:thiamine diphosphokinase n=1 Tax=Romboutsia sp. 1001713B170207_170306_H8 TaxID=2787112 RepID=UPI001899239F|nr:thiamine diphosphokinase [Romboutsia sp. 1001713B170207_170306_H8]
MKVCIVLNGEIKDYNKTKFIIENEKYDFIICADGGANHLYNMGVIPDYIIGDLDSAKSDIVDYYRKKNVSFKKFPAKKDETDSEICIFLAQNLNAKEIDFIGALGGRIDHTIANINLLYYIKEKGIKPRILSEDEEINILINEQVIINGNKGDLISVIPINGDANGVTLENLEYPLVNHNMKYSVPLGISNVMLDNNCKVSVNQGTLLIIKNIKK